MRVLTYVQHPLLFPILDGNVPRQRTPANTHVVVRYLWFAVASSRQILPTCCWKRLFETFPFVKSHQCRNPACPYIRCRSPSFHPLKMCTELFSDFINIFSKFVAGIFSRCLRSVLCLVSSINYGSAQVTVDMGGAGAVFHKYTKNAITIHKTGF